MQTPDIPSTPLEATQNQLRPYSSSGLPPDNFSSRVIAASQSVAVTSSHHNNNNDFQENESEVGNNKNNHNSNSLLPSSRKNTAPSSPTGQLARTGTNNGSRLGNSNSVIIDPLRTNLTTRGSSTNSVRDGMSNTSRSHNNNSSSVGRSGSALIYYHKNSPRNDESLVIDDGSTNNNNNQNHGYFAEADQFGKVEVDNEGEYEEASRSSLNNTINSSPQNNNNNNNNVSHVTVNTNSRTNKKTTSTPLGLPPRPKINNNNNNKSNANDTIKQEQEQHASESIVENEINDAQATNSSSSSSSSSSCNEEENACQERLPRSPESSQGSLFDNYQDEYNGNYSDNKFDHGDKFNPAEEQEQEETTGELSIDASMMNSAENNNNNNETTDLATSQLTTEELANRLIKIAEKSAQQQRDTVQRMEKLIGKYDASPDARKIENLRKATQLQDRENSRLVINAALNRFKRVENVVAQIAETLPSAEKLKKALDQQEFELNLIEVELSHVERDRKETLALDQWDRELQVRETRRRNIIANAIGSGKVAKDIKCGSDDTLWTLAPPSFEIDEILNKYKSKKQLEEEEEERRLKEEREKELHQLRPEFDAFPLTMVDENGNPILPKKDKKNARAKSPPISSRGPLFISQKQTIHQMPSRASEVFLVYVFVPMGEYARMWDICRESSEAALTTISQCVFALATEHRGAIADCSGAVSFLLSFTWGGEAMNFALELQEILTNMDWPKTLISDSDGDDIDDAEDHEATNQDFIRQEIKNNKAHKEEEEEEVRDPFASFEYDKDENSAEVSPTAGLVQASRKRASISSASTLLKNNASDNNNITSTSSTFPSQTVKNHRGRIVFKGIRVGITIHVASVAEKSRDTLSGTTSSSTFFLPPHQQSPAANLLSNMNNNKRAAPMFLHESSQSYVGPDTNIPLNLAKYCRGGEILLSADTWDAILRARPKTFYEHDAHSTKYQLRMFFHEYQQLMGTDVTATTSSSNTNNDNNCVQRETSSASSSTPPSVPIKSPIFSSSPQNNRNTPPRILSPTLLSPRENNNNNNSMKLKLFPVMQVFPNDLKDRALVLGAPPQSKLLIQELLLLQQQQQQQQMQNNISNGQNDQINSQFLLPAMMRNPQFMMMTPSQFTQQTTSGKHLPSWVTTPQEGTAFPCTVAVITIPNLDRMLRRDENQWGIRAWETFRTILLETLDSVNRGVLEERVQQLLFMSSSSSSININNGSMSLSFSSQNSPSSITRKRRQSVTQLVSDASIRDKPDELACFPVKIDFQEVVCCFQNPTLACSWAMMFQDKLQAAKWPHGLLDFNRLVYGPAFTGAYWNTMRVCIGLGFDEQCFVVRHKPSDIRHVDGAAFWIATEVCKLARGGEILVPETIFCELRRGMPPLKVPHKIEPVTDPAKTSKDHMLYSLYSDDLFPRRHDFEGNFLKADDTIRFAGVVKEIDFVRSKHGGVLSRVMSSTSFGSRGFNHHHHNNNGGHAVKFAGSGVVTSNSIITKQTLQVLTTIAQSTLSESNPAEYVDVLQITRSGAVTDKAVKVLLQIINGGIQNGLIDPKIMEGVSKKDSSVNRTAKRLLGAGAAASFSGKNNDEENGGSSYNNNSNNNEINSSDDQKVGIRASWNPFFAPKPQDSGKEKLALSLTNTIAKDNNNNNNNNNATTTSDSTCDNSNKNLASPPIVISVPGLSVHDEDGFRVDAKALPTAPNLLPSNLAVSYDDNDQVSKFMSSANSESNNNNSSVKAFGGKEGQLSYYRKNNSQNDDDENNNQSMNGDDEPESVARRHSVVKVPSGVGQDYYMKVNFIEDENTQDENNSSKKAKRNSPQDQKSVDEQSDPVPKRLGKSINKTQVRDPKALLAILLRERLRDRLFDSASYALGTSRRTKAKSLFLNDPLLQQFSNSNNKDDEHQNPSKNKSAPLLPVIAALSEGQIEAVERRIDGLKLDDILLLLKNIESEEQAILMEDGKTDETELFEKDRSFYEEVAAAMKAANIKNLPKRKTVGIQVAIGPAVLIERETVVVNLNDLDENSQEANANNRKIFHHHHANNHSSLNHHAHHHQNNSNNAATFTIVSGQVEPLSAAVGKRGRHLQEYLKHSGGVQVVRKELVANNSNNTKPKSQNISSNDDESHQNYFKSEATHEQSPFVTNKNHDNDYGYESSANEEGDSEGEGNKPQDDDEFRLERYRNSLSKTLKQLDDFARNYLHSPTDRLQKDIHIEIGKLKPSFFKIFFQVLVPAESWFQYSESETKKSYNESAWEQGETAILRWIKQDSSARKELNKKMWKLGFDTWKIEKIGQESKVAARYEVKHACIQLVLALTARTNLVRDNVRDLWISRFQSMSSCVRILLRLIRGKRKIDKLYQSQQQQQQQSQSQSYQQRNSPSHNNNSGNLLEVLSAGRRKPTKNESERQSRASTRTYHSSRGTITTAASTIDDGRDSFLVPSSLNSSHQLNSNQPERTLKKTLSSTTNNSTLSHNDGSRSSLNETDDPHHFHLHQQKTTDSTRRNSSVTLIAQEGLTQNNKTASNGKSVDGQQQQPHENKNEVSPRTASSLPLLPKIPFLVPSAEGDGNSSSANPMFASALATARAMDRLKQQQKQIISAYVPAIPMIARWAQSNMNNCQNGVNDDDDNENEKNSKTPNPSRQNQLQRQFQKQQQQQQHIRQPQTSRVVQKNELSGLHYAPFQFSSSPDTSNNTNNNFASSPQPPKSSRREMMDWITNINKAVKNHKKIDDGTRNPGRMV